MKYLFAFLIGIIYSNFNYAQDSYVVNAKSANIRQNPTSKSEKIGIIQQGEVVRVVNTYNPDWWLISYYGTEGYVSSKLLITLEESNKYRYWEKVNAITGDNYNCENVQPQYDTSIENELKISVGYNSDAVVKLMNFEDKCVRISFIKAGDTYSMKYIPLGEYYLKIAYGKEFRKFTENDQCIVKFLRDPIYEKGDQVLNFIKERKPDKVIDEKVYSDWNISYFELSLNVVFSHGTGDKDNFRSKKISENDFNK